MELRDVLLSIESDVARVRLDEAEGRLIQLIQNLGDEDLRHWDNEIRALVERFLPKRRKRLHAELAKRSVVEEPITEELSSLEKCDSERLDKLFDSIQDEFEELSQSHIFQWSTYYRECVESVFDRVLEITTNATMQAVAQELAVVVSDHVAEIFEKGFRFKLDQGKAESVAHSTALAGFQRFAELGVEYYSTAAMKVRSQEKRRLLRQIVSSFLSAALCGFAGCRFGSRAGAQLLAGHRIQWMHYTPFLTASGLDRLRFAMGAGATSEILEKYARPMVVAIDGAAASSDAVWLPQIGQYFHDQRKIEVLMHSPQAREQSKQVEIIVLTDPDVPTLSALSEAESRGARLVICGLRADVAASQTAERLQLVLVNVLEGGQSTAAAEQRALAILRSAIVNSSRGRSGEEPVEYNFARIFPLNNPFQTKYFHVVRKSVRGLLREIEGRSGVRLWCSVRRSGKTTACFDLSGARPGIAVIVQTCDVALNDESGSALFELITERIESGRPLERSFFSSAVESLKPPGSTTDRAIVILDEYETLFGRLRSALKHDQDIKYSIVYPLLSQIVAFSKDNLLVLVGQQPNAHYIAMEQNQLSAYVRQDAFPLFAHDPRSSSSEFIDFVTKVITESWSVTPRFVEEVYRETAGHPFLTVNLLVTFVDWLIANRVKVKDVKFDLQSWTRFAETELASNRIALNTEFQFFIEAAADAMSEMGRSSSPWLWAVYRSLRILAVAAGPAGVFSTEDFVAEYQRAGLLDSGISAEEILRTGSDANFFTLDSSGTVSAKIPVLARISAASVPRVN